MKKILIGLLSLFLTVNCYATQVTQHTTYATTSEVNSTNLNGNLQNIITVVNGNLDSTNTASGFKFMEVLGALPAAGTQGRVVFLTTDNNLYLDNGSAFNATVLAIGDIISRDFELVYANTTTLTVNPGTLYVGSSQVNTTATQTLTIATDSNWIDGTAVAAGTAAWYYVYVGADEVAKLEETAPAYSDTSGSTAGTKLYHKEGTTYYRCIGAVRVNTSNEIPAANKWFQSGNYIAWDIPVSLTSTPSSGAWSGAISCAASIPSISTRGTFGVYSARAENQPTLINIRPNGSTFTDTVPGGTYGYADVVGSTGVVGGMLESFTDSSQQIQHYDLATTIQISIKGYYLNIR